MRTQITNYQCPSCTGPLHYVGSSGKLECDFCGSSYDVAEIEALYAEKEEKAIETTLASEKENQMGASSDNNVWDTSDLQEWGAEEDQMQAYSCPSCGAELICDKSTAATSCPYCGNPTVIPGQFSGSLKPDYIIPFKVSKEDAVKALKEHYKGKILLPRILLQKTIFKRSVESMSLSGCLTVRQKEMLLIRQLALIVILPGIIKLQKQNIMMFTELGLWHLRECR